MTVSLIVFILDLIWDIHINEACLKAFMHCRTSLAAGIKEHLSVITCTNFDRSFCIEGAITDVALVTRERGKNRHEERATEALQRSYVTHVLS